jgi:diguanylate cyclase (GGDEF)-like protein
MSMYRQLWLLLLLSTLFSMVWSLSASTLSSRAYLQEQLRLKNLDNANTLALSLSQRAVDKVEMELTVAALFDSGNYEMISIVDPFEQILVERRASDSATNAPGWFVQLLPIVAQPGVAKISGGWQQVGSVKLLSHSRFAYNALWNSTWQMTGALTIAGLAAAIFGSLILARIRRPLNDVILQAQAITERRFTTVPDSPVPELRPLTRAMNSVVQRLKTMFDDEAARLEEVRQQTNQDSATGLSNRSYFMAHLRVSLEAEDARDGSLLLLRIQQLAELNRKIGRADTDQVIQLASAAIHQVANRYEDCLAGRLNGADFGLALSIDHQQTQALAKEILDSLAQSCAPLLQGAPIACIGIAYYQAGQNCSSLLAQVDAALASAEAQGGNSISTIQSTQEEVRSQQQWGELLQQAVAQRRVKLAEFPVVNFDGQLLHSECPLRLAMDAESGWLTAGQFLPLAERLDLTSVLDLAAVTLSLQQLSLHPELAGLAINLSARSVQQAHFRDQLHVLLDQHRDVASRLWLEVAEVGVLAHFDAFHAFCVELKGVGCRIGIEHFGRQIAQIGQLHDLGLDYIKVDASFIGDIHQSPGNQAFLKGLCTIAHSIDLQVIAEGVSSEAEMQVLAKLGFNGATGPAVAWPGH